MGFRAQAPAQNLGSYRNTSWPTAGGSGPAMQSQPTVAPGQNGNSMSLGAWHPTTLWMIGFVVVELAAFHFLSRTLKI